METLEWLSCCDEDDMTLTSFLYAFKNFESHSLSFCIARKPWKNIKNIRKNKITLAINEQLQATFARVF